MAVADDVVAIREHFQGGNPGEGDAGQVLLVQLPYDLFVGRDFQDAVAVACAEQGVAVFQAHRAEGLVAPGLGAVAVAVASPREAIPFMAHRVSAALQLAIHVAVAMQVVMGQRDRVQL